ncbi:MAG: di-trans,poly-cis-decaprenylcistransferase [Planctomycetes bacterium]|nr:di-trans,poly-cis-decaprenylcistransferase [Planctomycetota bacterium]
MDGNGRWAEERGMVRTKGHEAGVDSVRAITRECARLGVQSLTLYAFSVENWKRPRTEVTQLMRYLQRFLIEERAEIEQNRVRLSAIGRIADLPRSVRRELARTQELSAKNDGMLLRLALSYGGRTELVDAVRRIAEDVRSGRITPEKINEATIREMLYDPHTPDPDLLIRTAGEMRLSNFLLWQCSYSELYVTEVCWPEFRESELHAAFESYSRRVRKFGAVKPSRALGLGEALLHPLRAARRALGGES